MSLVVLPDNYHEEFTVTVPDKYWGRIHSKAFAGDSAMTNRAASSELQRLADEVRAGNCPITITSLQSKRQWILNSLTDLKSWLAENDRGLDLETPRTTPLLVQQLRRL